MKIPQITSPRNLVASASLATVATFPKQITGFLGYVIKAVGSKVSSKAPAIAGRVANSMPQGKLGFALRAGALLLAVVLGARSFGFGAASKPEVKIDEPENKNDDNSDAESVAGSEKDNDANSDIKDLQAPSQEEQPAKPDDESINQ